jgi:tetratricopeptide (TPR) repeat protein
MGRLGIPPPRLREKKRSGVVSLDEFFRRRVEEKYERNNPDGKCVNRGGRHFDAGNFDKARQYYLRAMRNTNPRKSDGKYFVIIPASLTGIDFVEGKIKIDGVIDTFEKYQNMLRDRISSNFVIYNLSDENIYRRTGDMASSARHYNQGRELYLSASLSATGDLRLLNALSVGTNYCREIQYDQAMHVFRRLINFTDKKDIVKKITQVQLAQVNLHKTATGKFEAMNLVKDFIFHTNAAVAASGNDEEQTTYFDYVLNRLAPIWDSTTAFGSWLAEGLKTHTMLFSRSHETEQVLSEQSTHHVFSLDDYVYKASPEHAAINEVLIANYFVQIKQGVVELKAMLEQRIGHLVTDRVEVELPIGRKLFCTGGVLTVPRSAFAEKRVQNIPKDTVIACYGKLPGRTLRDILMDDTIDLESKMEPVVGAVGQLSILHALGPLHLLQDAKVPRQDKEGMQKSYQSKRKYPGFSSNDWDTVIDAISPVLTTIDNRTIDSYVKDANPGNWIVPEVPFNITPIDFETTMIAGPQYDLVKLLEFSDITPIRDIFLERYLRMYNEYAQQFNRVVPKNKLKPIITDFQEFSTVYECYVIDHCIKSFHNPNYANDIFLPNKQFWTQRGMDSIDWLTEREEYSAADTAKISALKRIFEKYRDQTAARLG